MRLARSDSQTDLLRIAAAANQPIDTISYSKNWEPCWPGAPRYCVGLFGFGAIANAGNAATAVSIVPASTVLIGAFIVLLPCFPTRSQNLHLQHWLSRYRDSDNVSVLQLMRFRTRCFASEPALRSRAPQELRKDLIDVKGVGRSASLMQKLSVCSSTDHGCGKRRWDPVTPGSAPRSAAIRRICGYCRSRSAGQVLGKT